MTPLDSHETLKHVGDVAAVTVTVGTVASFLPALSAFFSIIWLVIRIYETKTVQQILARWRKS